jgi:hypothetical protein
MLNVFSLSDSPLKEAGISEQGRFPWPDPHNPEMFSGLREQARHWHENTEYVIVADRIKGGLLTKALQIRGYDGFFADLVQNSFFRSLAGQTAFVLQGSLDPIPQ